MICKLCGYKNSDSAKYCGKCGSKLEPRKKSPYVNKAVTMVILVCCFAIVCCLLYFSKTGRDIQQTTAYQNEWQSTEAASIGTQSITPSERVVPKETTKQNAVAENSAARTNQMSRDFIPPVPQDLNQDSNRTRGYLRSITFLDTLEQIPAEHVSDVSVAQDGSVLAWYEIEQDTGIRNLYIAANGKILAPENCQALFSCDIDLEEIQFNDCFDTSLVTNMSQMFSDCAELRALDLSSFDTSKVTDMSWMFHKTFSLQKLDLSTFDTSSVTIMTGMFSLSAIEEVDLSSFDTFNVTDMSGMFEKCGVLTELDISNFVTSTETDIGGMFYECWSLEMLDISGFDLSGIPQKDIPTWLFMDSVFPKVFITNDNLMD